MRQWVLHIIEALPGCWCHYRCRWSHEKKSCCCCCCRLSCSTSRWWNKVKRAKMLVRLFILNYSIYITWSNWDLHYFYFYANSNFWISGLTWIKCAGYEYARAGKSRLFNKGPTREKGIMQIRYIFHVSCSLSFPFYPLISWCDRKSCDVTLILSIMIWSQIFEAILFGMWRTRILFSNCGNLKGEPVGGGKKRSSGWGELLWSRWGRTRRGSSNPC